MAESPPTIDYACPNSGPAAGPRYLLAIAGCFGIAWLVWLGIGYANYDPFDDDLLPWLVAVAVMFGTPSGAILSLITVIIMKLRSRRHGSAS